MAPIFSFRLEEEQYNGLKKMAMYGFRTKAGVVRMLIQKALQEFNKLENAQPEDTDGNKVTYQELRRRFEEWTTNNQSSI